MQTMISFGYKILAKVQCQGSLTKLNQKKCYLMLTEHTKLYHKIDQLEVTSQRQNLTNVTQHKLCKATIGYQPDTSSM